MTHTLTLPPLTDLNTYINLERTNKFAAASIKKKETELVAWECHKQEIPALKLTKITFIWKHKNRRTDPDNREFSQKSVLEGLVLGGIIKNDSWDYRPSTTTHKHLVDKSHPGVEVILEGKEIEI